MNILTKERVDEILAMRSTDSRKGDMDALRRHIEALQKQLDYVRGIMQGQETECRPRESQEKVYRFQVETLRAELDRIKAASILIPEEGSPVSVNVQAALFVLPPYTWGDKHSAECDFAPEWQCAHQAGYELAASRARAIGPGEVVVDQKEWEAYRQWEKSARVDGRQAVRYEELICLDLLDAIRAQAKQGES